METVIFPAPKKKLIEFSHSSPDWGQYLRDTPLYESGPFDGITLRLTPDVGGGNVFMVGDWRAIDAQARLREKELAQRIHAETDPSRHFLALFGASQMDWFSDADWKWVEDQTRFVVGLAKAAGVRGILWDPEPYKPGKNPWRYPDQEQKGTFSYEAFYAQVKERGGQFMRIIQEEYPGAVLFSLRQLSDFQTGSPFSQAILPLADAEEATKRLERSWWGLHLPFTLGVVEAMDDSVAFVDGNEEAYYYTSALEYYKLRDVLYNQARRLMAPQLRQAFRARYTTGHAVAPEYIAGNWAGLLPSFPVGLTEQSLMLSPAERARWLEHNVYYALTTADEYAWIYSEKINWWTGENVPEGFAAAVMQAKEKVDSSQPLGFEVEDRLQKARADAAAKYAK